MSRVTIQMRTNEDFKQVALEMQENRNYSSLAEYIRHLILNDKKKLEEENKNG